MPSLREEKHKFEHRRCLPPFALSVDDKKTNPEHQKRSHSHLPNHFINDEEESSTLSSDLINSETLPSSRSVESFSTQPTSSGFTDISERLPLKATDNILHTLTRKDNISSGSTATSSFKSDTTSNQLLQKMTRVERLDMVAKKLHTQVQNSNRSSGTVRKSINPLAPNLALPSNFPHALSSSQFSSHLSQSMGKTEGNLASHQINLPPASSDNSESSKHDGNIKPLTSHNDPDRSLMKKSASYHKLEAKVTSKFCIFFNVFL